MKPFIEYVDIEAIIKNSLELIKKFINYSLRVPADSEFYNYRSCFMAYPYKTEFHLLFDEIEEIINEMGFDIKLLRNDLDFTDTNILNNIKKHIEKVHFGIADITGNNPNVLWELGLMMGLKKPVIILKNANDNVPTPFDLSTEYHLKYKAEKNDSSGYVDYLFLRKGIKEYCTKLINDYQELQNATRWDHSK